MFITLTLFTLGFIEQLQFSGLCCRCGNRWSIMLLRIYNNINRMFCNPKYTTFIPPFHFLLNQIRFLYFKNTVHKYTTMNYVNSVYDKMAFLDIDLGWIVFFFLSYSYFQPSGELRNTRREARSTPSEPLQAILFIRHCSGNNEKHWSSLVVVT